MPTHRLAPLLALTGLLACGPKSEADDTTGTTTTAEDNTTSLPTMGSGADDDGDEAGMARPQETQWQPVVTDLPFPLSGPGEIHTLTIGRKEYNSNFANRGDIEVLFDQTGEFITIEMRKYDFSDDVTAFGDEDQNITGTFERLSAWAYNVDMYSPAKPTPADESDPSKNCLLETWKDECSLYLRYDGQAQPVRSGADFRVHLPAAWRGELHLETEDNTNESTYPRLADIRVTGPGDAGWCGSGTARLASGRADIRLCRDLVPTPTCPPDQVEQCEQWQTDGAPAPWSLDCPCPADLFGQLRVASSAPWAADITVDVPAGVWLNAAAANQSENLPHDCHPTLDCAGDCTLTDDSPYSKAAEFNYPGPAAPSGAGYNLTVFTAGCTEVDWYESPADWSADATPMTALRGFTRVCSGCLE